LSNDLPEHSDTVGFGVPNPILPVTNLDASVDHYVNTLGFKLGWRADDMIASVSRGQCALFLSVGDQGHTGTWVWIGVGDAALLFEEYLMKGAAIRQAPANHGWALELQVQDPDGNVLRLGSDPDEAGPAGVWCDMRGDYWHWVAGTGWSKIVAADAASFFREQALRYRRDQNFQHARYAWFNAVDLLRQFGTKLELARALRELGEMERTRQNDAAQMHYDEAIALFRELDEPWPLAHALGHLGMLHHDSGPIEQAEGCYVEALSISRGCVDLNPLDLANTLNRLATFYEEFQRNDEAEPLLVEAHDAYLSAGIQAGVAGTAARLARVFHRRGQPERARDWIIRASAAAEAAGEEGTLNFVAKVRSEIASLQPP
jgi:tetratricopeptide (TPR) repeat protein